MARSSTTFKPGQITNPKGKPALPGHLKLLMKNTSNQMKQDLCEIYAMDLVELQTSEGKPGLTAGRAAIISAMNNAIQANDLRGLYIFFDRILGKVKEADPEGDDQTQATKDETINRLVAMFERKKDAT